MYAIVETGGKQIKVQVGDKVYVEKIDAEAGKDVKLDKVLYIGGEKVLVGNPYVSGAAVIAKVEKQGKQPKLTILKYKSKNNYRRKSGHRQPYTCLVIKEINA